ANSALRNAPSPLPPAAWAEWSAATCCTGAVGCACASAPFGMPPVATAPAPTAAPTRNLRRASSCLLMLKPPFASYRVDLLSTGLPITPAIVEIIRRFEEIKKTGHRQVHLQR